MTARPVIVWLRRDLRLADQAALLAAADSGAAVVPVYVLDDAAAGAHAMGGASRWWLHHSLRTLDAALREQGSRLILRRGDSAAQLAAVAKAVGAHRVHALHHYEPWWLQAERAVANALDLTLHDGNYLAPPGSIVTKGGTLFKIFTPFWRALGDHMPAPQPMPAPAALPAPPAWPASDDLDDWQLLPRRPDWAAGFRAEWTPGEAGAAARLDDFAGEAAHYGAARNMPSQEGTSRLSPHLHFGEISPATIWHALAGRRGTVQTFLGEIGWRDFAQTVILQFPGYGTANARDEFDRLPWRHDAAARLDLHAWQRGHTGYPIVDAGMRQLWTSGWMHNRVRMIAASFLIKHLLIDWREGERWFWDTLVDADYGSNAVNWQWTAGSGVDSNMFVRIMAPLSQSDKFDAAGYIREWVPELAHLPDAAIHDPPPGVPGYPAKLIEHGAARARALDAYRAMKG